MGKVEDQLIGSGCKIIENTDERIVVKCPREVLEAGLKVSGVSNVKPESRNEKEVVLILEKR